MLFSVLIIIIVFIDMRESQMACTTSNADSTVAAEPESGIDLGNGVEAEFDDMPDLLPMEREKVEMALCCKGKS